MGIKDVGRGFQVTEKNVINEVAFLRVRSLPILKGIDMALDFSKTFDTVPLLPQVMQYNVIDL
jgi:hypothetical protein